VKDTVDSNREEESEKREKEEEESKEEEKEEKPKEGQERISQQSPQTHDIDITHARSETALIVCPTTTFVVERKINTQPLSTHRLVLDITSKISILSPETVSIVH